jgi:DnaJ-class molecular chaperone
VPEEKNDPKEQPEWQACPDCLGRGKKARYKHGHPVVTVRFCDTCGGSGKIGPNGEKIVDSDDKKDLRKWSHIVK